MSVKTGVNLLALSVLNLCVTFVPTDGADDVEAGLNPSLGPGKKS